MQIRRTLIGSTPTSVTEATRTTPQRELQTSFRCLLGVKVALVTSENDFIKPGVPCFTSIHIHKLSTSILAQTTYIVGCTHFSDILSNLYEVAKMREKRNLASIAGVLSR